MKTTLQSQIQPRVAEGIEILHQRPSSVASVNSCSLPRAPQSSEPQITGLFIRAIRAIRGRSALVSLRFLLSTFCFLLFLAPASAATRYVWQDSPSPAPPYTSWATAATNIQDAVDAAAPGDTVLVTNGVYATGGTNGSRVHVDKSLNLLSVNGPAVTIIKGYQVPGSTNGAGGFRCVYLTNGASLSGFTLTNGATSSSDGGGGVRCESTTTTVSNCVLTSNSAYYVGGGASGGTLYNCVLIGNSAGFFDGLIVGTPPPLGGGGAFESTLNNCMLESNWGGLYDGGGTLQCTLYHCTVRGNRARRGGGDYLGTLNNCTVRDNRATSAGGGAYQSTVRNSVLTGNSASAGGGAYSSSLNNCTLTQNSASSGGGTYGGALKNCIVYFNTANQGANYWGGTLDHSCANPLLRDGIGNISDDPLLASATYLSADSPCRGAGNPGDTSGSDIDGEPWANPPSIGCDEYHPGMATGPLSVGIVATLTNVATGYPVEFTALVEGRPEASVWYFGDGLVASNRLQTSHAWAAPGDFSVVLTAYNMSNHGGITATVTVHVVMQTVHYVAADSTNPLPPYASWATAATSIQDAVDAAGTLPGALVLVTNGTYATGGRPAGSGTETNRVSVEGPITLRSVNGPGVTIIQGWQVPGTINGDGAVRCVHLSSGSSLTGFTLTNGATRTEYPESLGGGVACESSTAVVSNCVLIGNSAYHNGGGSSGGTLHHCTFSSNSAQSGGGASGGTLYKCTLTNNSAIDGGGATSSTLYNCSVIANSAHYDGGGAYGCTLTDCILNDNLSRYGWGGGSAFSTVNFSQLSGNRAVRGGGVFTGTIKNSTLADNSASEYGGGAYGYQSDGAWGSTVWKCSLNSCALTGNSAAYGGGAAGRQSSSDCILNNCTLTGNSATNTGGGTYRSRLNNSIVYFNTSPDGPNYDAYSSLYFTCTTPLPSFGIGNMSADPQLASASHLSMGSPCIGAGSGAYTSGADIDGEPWANPPSMGCDEFRAGPLNGPLSVSVTASHTNVGTGFLVELTALIQGPARLNVWSFGDGTIASNQLRTGHAWTSPGDYDVVLSAYNDGIPGGVSATVTVHVVTPPVHYVAVNSANPVAPYSSWATAATNIQDAVDIAGTFPGTLVLVSNGVYATGGRAVVGTMTNRVAVNKLVALRSVNGPEMTVIEGYQVPGIINGNGAIRCAYLANGASLSGFTLTNGATQSGQSGGGIWCLSTSVLVSNCVIIGNSAYQDGGGAYGGTLSHCALRENSARNGGATSQSTLNHCELSVNRASVSGGGAYQSTLDNCTLMGNLATAASLRPPTVGRGGGVYQSALNNCMLIANSARLGAGAYQGTLNNCTLTGNSATSSGGGVYSGTLNNCIVYFNSAPDQPNYHTNSTLNYSCTTPLPTNGVGNIDLDPLFVDSNGWSNLRLQPNSPCINAGNNGSVTWSTDLDGNPRILGGTVDMGAYEFVPPNIPPLADARATQPLWISPNGLNATVVLDGSRSSDPDGDPLTYLWLSTLNAQPSTTIASGVVAIVSLPVGIHAIALVVNDGLAQDTNTVTVTVLTTAQAVERLITLVNESDLKHKQPLLASLEAALASIQRGNCNSAANQLHAFQNKVRAQVADPVLAMALIQGAQQIIDALGGDGSTQVAGKVQSLKRQANGKLHLQFSGPAGQVHIVEASTNLVDWEPIGLATEQPDGSFQFEDAAAAEHRCRFYRIVEP